MASTPPVEPSFRHQLARSKQLEPQNLIRTVSLLFITGSLVPQAALTYVTEDDGLEPLLLLPGY